MPTKQPKNGPVSFRGLLEGHDPDVRKVARELRRIIREVLPETKESFTGGNRGFALYRTTADIAWLQPLKTSCNIYFMRGPELLDPEGQLQGTSDRYRYAKIKSIEDTEALPIREWLQEAATLNEASAASGVAFEEVLKRVRQVVKSLPNTKETLTWGKPHFRVGEKIFCGCGEQEGQPRVGLKLDPTESLQMMRVPGIENAPYSRKDDGWVSIDPNEFDDWDTIEAWIVDSFRRIAPARVAALAESKAKRVARKRVRGRR